jgi:hypothetical protein
LGHTSSSTFMILIFKFFPTFANMVPVPCESFWDWLACAHKLLPLHKEGSDLPLTMIWMWVLFKIHVEM